MTKTFKSALLPWMDEALLPWIDEALLPRMDEVTLKNGVSNVKELELDDFEWSEVLQALIHYADAQEQNLAQSDSLSPEQRMGIQRKIQSVRDLHATAIELGGVARKGVRIHPIV